MTHSKDRQKSRRRAAEGEEERKSFAPPELRRESRLTEVTAERMFLFSTGES